MTTIQKAVEDYLAMRQGLGYKLRSHIPALRDFAAFLKRKSASYITVNLALNWVQEYAHGHPANRAAHLVFVRGFAHFWSATDPRTEVPPEGLLPFRYSRKAPYIYTEKEIRALINAARHIGPANGLARWTYSTILGLLAATGLRISEALRLHRDDVDSTNGVLTIRLTKFKKSRLVPLHSSTTEALRQYARRRDSLYPWLTTPHFFVSARRGPLSYVTIYLAFIKVSCQIGLRRTGDHSGPRMHDLRHRFAVATLMDWYRRGLNVEQHLPTLSTYLGHTDVTDTYWYLSAVPELLSLTAKRLQKRWEDL